MDPANNTSEINWWKGAAEADGAERYGAEYGAEYGADDRVYHDRMRDRSIQWRMETALLRTRQIIDIENRSPVCPQVYTQRL